jgi:hypothetical protein
MSSDIEGEFMKAILASTLASLGLAFSPLAAQTSAGKDVSFEDAMACSSLYAVLSSYAADEAEMDELIDATLRWLRIAMNRNGNDDFEVAQRDLDQWVNSLTVELDAQADDEERQAFLLGGVDECEANREAIAAEFDSIDMN